mmetsp:Transcript_10788/g.22936  ORF Transcript_10788/g.22936 Transcript_10788/m.22936 type:complete len:198 (-) Transcript_10788:2280-2873(-)
MSITLKSLLLFLVLGLHATNIAAGGLRGKEPSTELTDSVDADADQQLRRKLPEGQPNYGLTPSEHYDLYGYVDGAGQYGEYYYDGSDYERGTYGHPWNDPNWYNRYQNAAGSGTYSSSGNYYSNNNGYYANGPYSNGYYYANGPYSNGYYANGPYSNGYYANGPYSNGYYANGSYGNGHYGSRNGRRNTYRTYHANH